MFLSCDGGIMLRYTEIINKKNMIKKIEFFYVNYLIYKLPL